MKFLIFVLSFLPAITILAQQHPPFSEKTIKTEDGTLLLPYTKGEVKKNISGVYTQVLNKICSIITAWDSISPPQGMEVNCFGYGQGLEIYFRNYFLENGGRFSEEGGTHLSIYVNDPLKTVDLSVAPGIYLCPQKTANFYDYPIYNVSNGYEVTIVAKTKIPLYIPVSQKEYLKTLIAKEENNASESSPPNALAYQTTLLEMEQAYQKLLKMDKEAAKNFKQELEKFKAEINTGEIGTNVIDPVALLRKELSGLTDEEKTRQAYYGGAWAMDEYHNFSGLVPYDSKENTDALIRPNPALIDSSSINKIQLLVICWSVGDSNINSDKPRLYNEGRNGFHRTDNLMTELYNNKNIWEHIFSLW
ncbi:MAG: hypothetical protein PHH37_15825 [Paludibacter sp.]|nr:hypothetical protein [Paludibacter sp.]